MKLAGEDICKRLNAEMESYPINKINIFDLINRTRIPIQLPAKAKIRSLSISNDHQKAALLNETEHGVQLIIADLLTGECNNYADFFINEVLDHI